MQFLLATLALVKSEIAIPALVKAKIAIPALVKAKIAIPALVKAEIAILVLVEGYDFRIGVIFQDEPWRSSDKVHYAL